MQPSLETIEACIESAERWPEGIWDEFFSIDKYKVYTPLSAARVICDDPESAAFG